MEFVDFENIETKRLLLRNLELSDIPLYYERLSSNPEIPKYMLWDVHKSIEETKEYVTNSVKKYDNGNYYKWAIALKDSNELIGIIELLRFDESNNSCSFGYMLAKDFWNKGYATEALSAAIEFGFNKLGLSKILSDHFSENIASGKVMQKVGMKYIKTENEKYEKSGKKYNAEVYCITKEDFLSRNK